MWGWCNGRVALLLLSSSRRGFLRSIVYQQHCYPLRNCSTITSTSTLPKFQSSSDSCGATLIPNKSSSSSLIKGSTLSLRLPCLIRGRGISTSISRVVHAPVKEDDEAIVHGDKILKVKLAHTRLDAILKAGLTISRNKIEKAFYEDRVRVNGIRPKKKSQLCSEGDEIDIVKGPNKVNPLFIDVNRVEIMEVGEEGDTDDDDDYKEEGDQGKEKIPMVLKRSKGLTIENYAVPWKGNPQD